MSSLLPPHIADSMMAVSRKLFNASQDGDALFAESVMKQAISTLNHTLTLWEIDKASNGTH
jgi:hypothetical protein